jgi:hypothetical protein
MGVMTMFKVMLIAQLFFGFGISIIAHTLPADAQGQLGQYQQTANKVDLSDVTNTAKTSLERQVNLPLIEVGAIVFYSGNIILDLLLNFMFAVPEMLGLLIYAIMSIISFDTYLASQLLLMIEVGASVLYIIGLIQLVSGLRSGVSIA